MPSKAYYCCSSCGIIDKVYINCILKKSITEIYKNGLILDYEEEVLYTQYVEFSCYKCSKNIYKFSSSKFIYDFPSSKITKDLAVIIKKNSILIGNIFRNIYIEYLNSKKINFNPKDLDGLIIEDILRFETNK